jgi:hypothetical protein
MGHSAQLQSVQAGGWFKQVTHQHADELDEALLRLDAVIRQRDELEGKALNELAARTPQKWVEYQQKHGRLRGYGLSAEERHQAAVDAVSTLMTHDQDQDVLLISPTNQLRKDLNVIAQAEMRAAGRVTGVDVGLATSEGDTIHEGEKLILKRNDRELGVDNGTRARALGEFFGGLRVQIKDREVLLPNEYVADYVRLGYAVTIHDSQGATADHAIVVTPVKNLDAELAYVAASRARKTTTMFVLSEPDPQWKNLKARMRLEGAEATATQHIQAAEAKQAQVQTPEGGKRVEVVEPPTVNGEPDHEQTPATAASPEPAPAAEVADVVSEPEPAAAQQPTVVPEWPVSELRNKVAEIDARYERAVEMHGRVSREAKQSIDTIREIDARINEIKHAAREDAQNTKRRHRDQLDARQSRRQEELDRLAAQRAELGNPRNPEQLFAEFIAFGEQSRTNKARVVEDAAIEEIEIGTPIFERTLGPRPEPGSRAREMWNKAALKIGKHRVEHEITDPYQHGIDLGDSRTRGLVREVDRAAEQLSRHWAKQGIEIQISPIKELGQGHGHEM